MSYTGELEGITAHLWSDALITAAEFLFPQLCYSCGFKTRSFTLFHVFYLNRFYITFCIFVYTF